MKSKKKPTSKAVAELAGVSPTTVSMVLNNYKNVSFTEETRNRIFDACEKLGYKKTFNVAYGEAADKLLIAICPSYENMHYVTLISAMQERAKELGYSLIAFSTCRDKGEETKVLQLCGQFPFAGVLFLYHPENLDALQSLSWKKPVVHVYDKSTKLNIDTLELDSYKLGSIVGEHLIKLKHEHIAYISTPLRTEQIARTRRLKGLYDAYRKHGLDPETSIYVCTVDTEKINRKKLWSEYETGYHLAGRLIDRKEPVTAFAGLNDMVAFGIMDAILERGKRIPRDYSVCGCDNVKISGCKRISLTTVEHYSRQKGREAVEMLVRKIEDENEGSLDESSPISVTRVEYSPKLIKRESTGKLNKKVTC